MLKGCSVPSPLLLGEADLCVDRITARLFSESASFLFHATAVVGLLTVNQLVLHTHVTLWTRWNQTLDRHDVLLHYIVSADTHIFAYNDEVIGV